MKTPVLLTGAFAALTFAQTPAPYTDVKSGITFNTLQHSSGTFFGLALPSNGTGNTDFIATIGGKGTGYSGVSLGGGMLGKLLFVAWPNQQSVVSSFRKTAYVARRVSQSYEAYTAVETTDHQLWQLVPSRNPQSQMAPTLMALTGHIHFCAPIASRLTAPHSKQLTPCQALGMCLTQQHRLRRPTLQLLSVSILHRVKQCLT
jgi:hypothetical protein